MTKQLQSFPLLFCRYSGWFRQSGLLQLFTAKIFNCSRPVKNQVKCIVKSEIGQKLDCFSTHTKPWYTYYKEIKTKEEKAVTDFVENLLSSEAIDRENADLLKEMCTTDLKDLLIHNIKNRNLKMCWKIHKVALEQIYFNLAFDMLLILRSELELLSENENIILNRMLTDFLETTLRHNFYDNYFRSRLEFRGRLTDNQIGRLLYNQLRSRTIALDVFIELVLNEHFILTEREANFITELCHRNGELKVTPVQVKNLQKPFCPNCGGQLKKVTIHRSFFNDALKDFVAKMSTFYAERDVCTLYFKSLRMFLNTHGPFDICVDAENLYVHKKQFLSAIKSLPKNKRIFMIVSNDSALAHVKLPPNVTSFRVDRFAFREQDDILTLLSVLLNGPDTVLISNDSYRDIILLLDDKGRDTLQKWQRINQWPFTFKDNHTIILFPKLFCRSAQESKHGWHVPYRPEGMPTHEAAFLCIRKINWKPSQEVRKIRDARLKYLHGT